MKKTAALDFWVGLFVVLGFVALLFLALKAGNMSSLSFQATYPVKLKFDNIGGLKARAPVKSAGVTVGRVDSIGFDSNTYQAVVTIDLDKQYQFPKDTSAKILTSGSARRAVHRPRTRRRRPDAQGGRHHLDDAIGDRAGKPDRTVSVQQGGGFGCVEAAPRRLRTSARSRRPGAASAWARRGRSIRRIRMQTARIGGARAFQAGKLAVAAALAGRLYDGADADQGRPVRRLQPDDVHGQRQDRSVRAEAGREGVRVGGAAAGARQRDELLLEHRRRLHRGEQSAAVEDHRRRVGHHARRDQHAVRRRRPVRRRDAREAAEARQPTSA